MPEHDRAVKPRIGANSRRKVLVSQCLRVNQVSMTGTMSEREVGRRVDRGLSAVRAKKFALPSEE
jgi:hypothetical protein